MVGATLPFDSQTERQFSGRPAIALKQTLVNPKYK